MNYDAVVMGVSAGGLAALSAIIPKLDQDLPVPVMIVQHLSPDSDDFLPRHLDSLSPIRVTEAEDKQEAAPGTVYTAPANYHLMVDENRFLVLSVDQRVNYSRPSIDVLFEAAADVYQKHLIGVILTGANEDGAKGVFRIKRNGGMVIVQSPETAQADTMPNAAIQATQADMILPLDDIGVTINQIIMENIA